MFNTNTLRRTGLALALGSLAFILNKANELSRVFLNRPMPDMITGRDSILLLLGQVLLVVGLFGFYRLYAARVSGLAKIGLLLLPIGGFLLALGHISFTPIQEEGPFFLFVILGVLLLMAGLILFGALNLRARVLPYAQPLPLLTGILGVVAFFFAGPGDITDLFLVLRTLFGVGLVWMGVILFLDSHAVPAPAVSLEIPAA